MKGISKKVKVNYLLFLHKLILKKQHKYVDKTYKKIYNIIMVILDKDFASKKGVSSNL